MQVVDRVSYRGGGGGGGLGIGLGFNLMGSYFSGGACPQTPLEGCDLHQRLFTHVFYPQKVEHKILYDTLVNELFHLHNTPNGSR